jgi:hypothetical protein
MVQWLKLLRIREVRDSNVGSEAGYRDWRFLVVFLSPYKQFPG